MWLGEQCDVREYTSPIGSNGPSYQRNIFRQFSQSFLCAAPPPVGSRDRLTLYRSGARGGGSGNAAGKVEREEERTSKVGQGREGRRPTRNRQGEK